MISIFLDLTASRPALAMELQLTNHCGFIIGSTTSLVLEQTPKLISFFFVSLYNPWNNKKYVNPSYYKKAKT
jgi:hypothetical protein